MADPGIIAAMLLDLAIGWPAAWYARVGHPVGAIARVIAAGEGRWNTADRSAAARRGYGVMLMAGVILLSGGVAWLAQLGAHALPDPAGWIAIAVLAWPALAMRSLAEHVRPIAVALEARDLPRARAAVARIVGRDTATLDDNGVARAAIESLSESLCDGVVAPLFWFAVAGLPGLWAYKAINTADSLIGHREDRWRAFGWAAARIDDGANWIPARLSGVLLCVVGGGGWRVMWRDARRHASPNAGWPEAAMAGALRVALAGPVAYDGVLQDKPWIGAAGRLATSGDLRRALVIYRRVIALLLIVAGGWAWWG
ncbi:adenosylcobinamide-phosphate synthase CbiB [Sphingomonas sp.]|uniref:adenosylcobinamide-phosphate synthase CbiB n=1 Tax=Sphingomonas sp. TaxID=28214 RepID=UPI0035C7B791